jgi:hypothetical protein
LKGKSVVQCSINPPQTRHLMSAASARESPNPILRDREGAWLRLAHLLLHSLWQLEHEKHGRQLRLAEDNLAGINSSGYDSITSSELTPATIISARNDLCARRIVT